MTAGVPVWRREPFRVLFPLGVALAWVGVGHWLVYWAGLRSSYSCQTHGLIQLQAFLPAFAAGFLLTAVPRRTASAPASRTTLALVVTGLVVVVGAGSAERLLAMQAGYLLVWGALLGFALPRLRGAGAARRPPASFVLVPIGVLHGVLGALALGVHLAGGGWVFGDTLGRLFVEQGVFLCLSLGVGGLFYPLMDGAPPPADIDASPRERRRMVWFALAGVAISASLVAEAVGFERGGPLLRAVVMTVGLVAGVGAVRRPVRPGLNRHLVWAALWMQPVGLALAAAFPALRVAALHVTFIGGFGLLALGVGAHVVLSHGGHEALRDRTPWPVVVWSGAVVLALLARLVADWSDTYFSHLASAAAVWMAGTAVWLGFLAPALTHAGDEGPAPGPPP